MKQVYLVEDLRLAKRLCALAEMLDAFADAAMQRRAAAAFHREAEMLAALDNQHIPRVYDNLSEQNRHYLVMEYIEGTTLEQKLALSGGTLGEDTVVEIGLQIAEALEYLHALKPPIVYRDLKPSNVMVNTAGLVKLIDFGIARYFQPLKTGTAIGTQGYAAPEQFRGKAEVRSDIYGLGATMHHLLTGRDPATEPPCSFPPIEQLRPPCNPALARLINAALAYKSENRPASAAEFRRLLNSAKVRTPPQVSRPAHSATTQTTVTRPALQNARQPLSPWIVSGAVGFVTIVVLASLSLFVVDRIAPEHVPETPEASSEAKMSPLFVLPTPETAHKERKHAASAKPFEESEDQSAESHPRYFTIGSTKQQVLAIQGTPSAVQNYGALGIEDWDYGYCQVEFSEPGGRVKSYDNSCGRLRVRLK